MPEPVAFSPCPEPFNLAAHVLRAGSTQPDKIALRILHTDQPEETWSYGALIQAVRGTGTGLLAQGLSPGDIVLMRLGNTPDFPIAYLGALAAGLVPVPTSSALAAGEVAKIIAQLSPRLILRDPAVPCPDGHPQLSLAALRNMRIAAPCDWHMGDPDRLGYIIFTSGTSGTPAAVMHAHRAIWARQMMFDGWYGLSPQDRLLHAGAFNWTYTLGTGLMDPWTIGATALVPAPGTPPAALPDLLAGSRATIFAAAPGVYRQMLRSAAQLDLPDLRHGLSAGEKMTPAAISAWTEATGTPVYEAFGMSECSTFISGCPGHPAKHGTMGRAQPGRRVTLRDHNGEVAAGKPGTIAVHRSDPGLMLGYHNAPEQTALKFDGEWFLTGDQAMQDSDGQFTYLGRADDMMNAGGFRVSPLEVEAALSGAPGVGRIGVTEVRVKDGVNVIAAFCASEAPLDVPALEAYAETHLARYKQPRIYVRVDTLPTGANGKLLRRQLRQTFEGQNL